MIILTGVTGWLGRTALDYLIKFYDEKEFSGSVKVFASKNNIIKYQGREIKVHKLSDMNKVLSGQSPNYLFHTAFLTKDKLKKYGIKEYKNKNIEIIDCIEELINNFPKIRLVCSSSGAAKYHFEDKKDSISFDIYGYLKAQEEKRLSKYKNCLILRIYSLSGYHIRSPKVFALADFICQSLNKGYIDIKAKGKVLRSYASAENITEYGCKWLFSNKEALNLDACTDTLDLITLAKKVNQIIGNKSGSYNKYDNIISNYSASGAAFKKELRDFGINHTSINLQIKLSVNGIIDRQLNTIC